MVKILDGEIVQDDDPRLTRPRPSSTPAPASASDGGNRNQAPGSLFNWAAPPIRIAWEAHPDQQMFGEPGLEVYGLYIPGLHLLGVAAAASFFGWRGALMSAALWFFWKSSNHAYQAPPPRPGARPAAGQGETDAVRKFFQAPAGRPEYTPGTMGGGSSQGGQRPTQKPSGWEGKGQGQKLGSA